MRSHPFTVRVLLLATTAFVAGVTVAAAQTPAQLPLGETTAGQVSGSEATVYQLTAAGAGVLTVAIHAESDVTLTVTDQDGQALPDGSSDRDLYGSAGNEQVMVALPAGGEYRVRVGLLGGGSSTFEIGASWIAMPAFARATDEDGRPGLAQAIEAGISVEDTLDSDQGDNWDWFVITAGTAGTLTVILRSVNDDSPDLALELYTADDLTEYSVRSDNDLQGNTTNESGTIDVTAGEKVFVKVLGATGGPTGPYRLASSVIE